MNFLKLPRFAEYIEDDKKRMNVECYRCYCGIFQAVEKHHVVVTNLESDVFGKIITTKCLMKCSFCGFQERRVMESRMSNEYLSWSREPQNV